MQLNLERLSATLTERLLGRLISATVWVHAALVVSGVFWAEAGWSAPVRVLVWDEQQPEQKKVYPDFLGNHIAARLKAKAELEVTSANIHDPEQGLSEERLEKTDVLVWWGHVRHDQVPQKVGDAIVERIKQGKLSMIALHSAHWAVPFRTAMEARLVQETARLLPVRERANLTHEFMQWRSNVLPSRNENQRFDAQFRRREDGGWHLLLERPSCVFPSCCTPAQPSTIRTLLPRHPIARGVPERFTLPETEMYDEPFHVPTPDEVIFEEHWAGGEYFRSGMTWRLGRGQVFYFRPGHETYRVYTEPVVLKILENACAYLGGQVQANRDRKSLEGVVKRLLVFSKTSWYRHPAIPMIDDRLVEMGMANGFEVDVTEDAATFVGSKLGAYNVILLVSTTDIGKSLEAEQKEALIRWYRAGNGLIGIHAAGVHHGTWDWFNGLMGTDFDSDSEYVPARVQVDPGAANHHIVRGLEAAFWLDGDWLNFKQSVRGLEGVTVLLTLDERSYDPVRPLFKARGGKPMGKDHPMAWIRRYEGGRFAYTMIGHDTRPLDTDFGEDHLLRLIRWAAGAED